MASRYSQYLTRCSCGRSTSKAYARQHGACKACVEGIVIPKRQSYDDIVREGGYEDTMGVSPDCLESYRNGGSYYGD